jgi:sec-independent protein translocase protein TatC
VFQFVLQFLFSFNAAMGIDPDPRISEWLSFVIMMPLMFGISFQLPLVMLFLERIGVFTVASYMSKWRIAVLVIAVLAMVLSPGGDPMSMLLMFIPLVGLFFLGIWLCHYMREDKAAAPA